MQTSLNVHHACTTHVSTHDENVNVKTSSIVRIATHSVCGLSTRTKQTRALDDMDKYSLDICCLQEVKVRQLTDREDGKHRTILIPGRDKQLGHHYGMGFIIGIGISHRLKIKSYVYVTDRIATAEIELSPGRTLIIINVYAPTQARADKYEAETDQFYQDLTRQLKMHDSKNITTIVAGDFNAKVGQRGEGEECMGLFTRGRRNNNGQRLVEFCENYNLTVANSLFKHRACHTTTWE